MRTMVRSALGEWCERWTRASGVGDGGMREGDGVVLVDGRGIGVAGRGV